MLSFDFLDKSLGIVSPAHFVYFFHQKCFSCCILLTDQISLFWLPLLLEILGNMCIAIVCEQGCDVKNFRINLIFLIKPFLYMNRKSRQELKYLENEKSF